METTETESIRLHVTENLNQNADSEKRIPVLQNECCNRAPSTVVVKLFDLNPENVIPPLAELYTCYTAVPYIEVAHIRHKIPKTIEFQKKINQLSLKLIN